MLMFTLAISCLTTSNLPWFMDLTLQVPMQYCSLQHQTLLPSPVTSTIGRCFCFGSGPSLFLELFLHWSPVAYWAHTNLGSSSFSVLSFCLFILFMGFSRREYWSGLPSLLQWTTFCQTSPPRPVCLGWPHRAWLSFIELDKLWSMWSHWLAVCDCGFCLSALWCPLSVPAILLGFLLPWTWVSLHGSSNQAQPWLLTSDVRYLLSAAAPDLGRAVAPPGRTPAPSHPPHSCAMGDPKKWPLKGTLAFAKSSERTQNLLTFSPSGPSVGIRVSGTHATCLPVASLSPVPLCLSPSGFLDDPYSTFHAHMISWRGFWGSLWSRSFSYIQKPEGSKALLTFWRSPSNYAYLSSGEGTKLPPPLNILKNSLVTTPASQDGEGPSFPHSCKFP